MKYSKELLLKSIEFVTPNLDKILSVSVINLPMLINSAIISYSLMFDLDNIPHNANMGNYQHIVLVAKRELNTLGYLEFGDITDYWSH